MPARSCAKPETARRDKEATNDQEQALVGVFLRVFAALRVSPLGESPFATHGGSLTLFSTDRYNG